MRPRCGPQLRHFTLACDADHPERNEDACRSEVTLEPEGWRAFLVVADGAGSTLYAGAWARALVASATEGWLSEGLGTGIERTRETFDPLAGRDERVDFMLSQKWLDLGSAATFLAAAVDSSSVGTTCRVVSVGDSVLIIAGPDSLTSFPLTKSSEFLGRSDVISTHGGALHRRDGQYDVPRGAFVALASDGIGQWLIRMYEREGADAVYAWLGTTEPKLPAIEDDLTLVVLDCRPGLE